MGGLPVAFLSYSHFDDDHDGGYLTKFRERLSGEVRIHTAKDFPIFQDRDSIEWGQNWTERITESLQSVTFLIPIITPNYFASQACIDELKLFIDHETKSNRNDLILPIYYITSPQMEKSAKSTDEIVKVIKDHQWKNWRDLRSKDQNSVKFKERLEKLALGIRDAMERIQNSQEAFFETSPETKMVRTNAKFAEKSNSDIRRLVVDKNAKDAYDNINKALTAANPGDRIIVRPGVYEEGLIIDKNIEIIGEGDLDSIIIKIKDKSVITSIAKQGLVSNISLQQVGGNWFCVDIPHGSIEIRGCDITSQGSSCVGIHHGGDPILKGNRIHGSTQGGVFVFDNGKGILEDNEIYENSFSGIEIKNFGNPILHHNIIRKGRQGGVLVHNNGQGIFKNNDISNNIAGVEIRDGGNPTLRNNKIYDNVEMGIVVHDNGLGLIEDNDIFGNGYDCVGIRSNGNPVLRSNRIHDGVQGGVYILDKGLGVLEDNDIFKNASDGVAIRSQGNPKLSHNRIFDGKSDGIYIWDNGLGVIEDNDIFGNLHGVEIETNSNPLLQRNLIHDNRQFGISINKRGRGILELNDIFKNAVSGVQISTSANPVLRHNKIHGSKQSGILICENGSGIIDSNDIYANCYSGIEITTSANPKITKNNIRDGKQNGILVHNKGKGILDNNNILWNNYSGIEILSTGNPIICHNSINMNGRSAINVLDGGFGKVDENDLRGNSIGSLTVSMETKKNLKYTRNLE